MKNGKNKIMEMEQKQLVILPSVIYTPNFSDWVGGKSQSARMRKWFWNYVEWNSHWATTPYHPFILWAAQKVQKHGKNKLFMGSDSLPVFMKFCTFLTVTLKDYGKN